MKKFATTLEYEAKFPSKPGDGLLQSITHTVKRAIGNQLSKSGWHATGIRIESTDEVGKYKLTIPIARKSAREFQESMALQQLDTIYGNLASGLPGWKRLTHVNGDTIDDEPASIQELLAFPDDWQQYFGHIYERDLQINEMMDAIRIARDTNLKIRNHVLLYGEPSVGKSEILLCLNNIFSDLAVKRLDATNTTKAGAIDFFLKADYLPPVVVIEEIDKVISENDLSWFLSILDNRGEIIKTNARVGSITRVVRPLVIATINNIEKVATYHEGALLSRFSLPLYCPLPTEDVIKKILSDHIEDMPNGNPAWIEPAIRFALDDLKIYHVRRIKSIMTIGRDRLLDGSYQREHLALREVEHKDMQKMTEFVK